MYIAWFREKKKKKKITNCVATKAGFHIKAVDVIWILDLLYFSPASLDFASWSTRPTLQTQGRSLCNGVREIYPCYRGPEIMVVSSLIPPLPPNVALVGSSKKSSIAVLHSDTNYSVSCLTRIPLNIHSRTSVAQISLRPWTFVLDTGSSSHWRLIIAPGKETNGGNICITKTYLFKYIENFTPKNLKFSGKKLWYFSYICLKHRLWVLVRTASTRRF